MASEELMERVQREESEWLMARLHEAMHHNWLGRDECPDCLDQDAEDAGDDPGAAS